MQGSMAMKTTKKPQDTVNDIMKQMAGRMDALLDARERTQKARETGVVPDELRFWLAVDPLLADLNKQFIDARAQHIRLSRLHGPKDPMTDVADDMVDSAQCAFETRLLELRKDEDSKRTVLALMRRAYEMHQRDLNEQALAETHQMGLARARPRGRNVVKEGTDSFWFVVMGMMVLRAALMNATERLTLANAFLNAAKSKEDITYNQKLLSA
jgi:hypothetical protein